MLQVPGNILVGILLWLPIRYAGLIVSYKLLNVSRGLFPCSGSQDASNWTLSRLVGGPGSYSDIQGDPKTRTGGWESWTDSPCDSFL